MFHLGALQEVADSFQAAHPEAVVHQDPILPLPEAVIQAAVVVAAGAGLHLAAATLAAEVAVEVADIKKKKLTEFTALKIKKSLK